MKKVKLQLIGIALMLVVSAMACNFSASTAKIKDAYLSTTEDGAAKTTSFAQDQPFYAIVTLSNAPDDTAVKAVWYAVDAEGADPNQKIDEVTLTGGDGTYPFSLKNDGPWPLGSYKVELWLNDKLDKTLEFTVE